MGRKPFFQKASKAMSLRFEQAVDAPEDCFGCWNHSRLNRSIVPAAGVRDFLIVAAMATHW
jgi:hypothetical protein